VSRENDGPARSRIAKTGPGRRHSILKLLILLIGVDALFCFNQKGKKLKICVKNEENIRCSGALRFWPNLSRGYRTGEGVPLREWLPENHLVHFIIEAVKKRNEYEEARGLVYCATGRQLRGLEKVNLEGEIVAGYNLKRLYRLSQG
jgi:hypothetical protein